MANVNTIRQTEQNLNHGMTQLKQCIADKDQTDTNPNIENADHTKHNAYYNEVGHEEERISGTPNVNV
ncbi:hypothetical protein, partial [Staphylococcus aureus]